MAWKFWLGVLAWREKLRSDCAVSSVRTAQNEDGRVFDLPDRTWSGGSVGTDYFDFFVDTTTLPVGEYTLDIVATYLCPERSYIVPHQLTRFRVIE